jgi:predicted MFS family arabinose efflux permease
MTRDPTGRPWLTVLQGAAALAATLGIGRFVYTPILPLMHEQAGLTNAQGSLLATANYIGYLAGALMSMFIPRVLRSRTVYLASLLSLVAAIGLMAAARDFTAWFALRFIAGLTCALVFVIVSSAMLSRFRQRQYLAGWGFGGIGVGIALSGVLVLVVRTGGTWRTAWIASAVLALALSTLAWSLRPAAAEPPARARQNTALGGNPRSFAILLTSYTLEGVGYVIAGTFMVAAIDENSPTWVGSTSWVLVGLAAVPASALWARLGAMWSWPGMLCLALLLQACGIALPAVAAGVAPALVAAVLFGGTVLGIVSMALTLGNYLRVPRAVALLTSGYGLGQVAGPLVATPLLRGGYHVALLVGSAIVLTAALAAAALAINFPGRQPSSGLVPAMQRGLSHAQRDEPLRNNASFARPRSGCRCRGTRGQS